MDCVPVGEQITVSDAKDCSAQCVWCGGQMVPEHAHYRCQSCGQRDACCEGVY